MRRDFDPVDSTGLYGRCRICDLPYSPYVPREVRHHVGFHQRYLRALDDGWAPLPERDRERLHEFASTILNAVRPSFDERLRAAEAYFRWKFDGHRFGALYHDVKPRTVANYFTKRIDEKGLLDPYGQDVVDEMRRRYAGEALVVG